MQSGAHEPSWAVAAEVPWRREGETLVRDLSFRDFEHAMDFLQSIAKRAEDHGRHPDVRVSRGRVRLSIANPHRLGITLAELRLAAKVNAVVDGHP